MSKAWQHRIRERARQLWEKEGRPEGRNQEHWARAENELWEEALVPARELAKRLNRMRRNLDNGTEEGLQIAAEVGCEAMKFLIEETDFVAQVRAREGRPPLVEWSPEAKAYLDELELLEDFLDVERQILIRSGLDPVLTDQIITVLKGQLAKDEPTEVAHFIEVAVHRACEARDVIRERRRPPAQYANKAMAWYRRTVRTVYFALGSAMVVVANAAAEAMIYATLVEVSKDLGLLGFSQYMDSLVSSQPTESEAKALAPQPPSSSPSGSKPRRGPR